MGSSSSSRSMRSYSPGSSPAPPGRDQGEEDAKVRGGKRRPGGMAAPRPRRKQAAKAATRRGTARGRAPGGRPRRAGPGGRASSLAAALSATGEASPAGGVAGWRRAGPGRAGAAGRASGSGAGKPPSPTDEDRCGPGRRGAGPGRAGTALGRPPGVSVAQLQEAAAAEARGARPSAPATGGGGVSVGDDGVGIWGA